MSKTKKLISNTLIFGLGTFGSKLLQYFLLPYYTALLTTSQYGIIDNLQNIGTLCVPIVSLTIAESVFRYAMDKNNDKDEVYSIGLLMTLLGGLVFFILSLLFYLVYPSFYVWIVYLYVVANMLRTLASQYVRAIGMVKLFSIDNIFMTLMILVLNIFFLSFAKLGINGYMFAYILGNLLSFILLSVCAKLYKNISFKIKNKLLCKRMLQFSVPLIPNSMCWWISSCSNRFMITAMISASVNGLFAIASKIPTVMTLLINIFIQAWQMSANEESDNKNIATYYSDMFKYISALLGLASLAIITLSKLIIIVIANVSYRDAWIYIPVLTLSVVFYSKAQFLGTVYTTFKKTSMAFYTNLFAAIINIVGNLILIKLMGALGAAISTTFSYLCFWIVRQINVKSLVDITIDVRKEIISTMVILLNVVNVMLGFGAMSYVISFVLIICSLLIYKNEIFSILKRLHIL